VPHTFGYELTFPVNEATESGNCSREQRIVKQATCFQFRGYKELVNQVNH